MEISQRVDAEVFIACVTRIMSRSGQEPPNSSKVALGIQHVPGLVFQMENSPGIPRTNRRIWPGIARLVDMVGLENDINSQAFCKSHHGVNISAILA
jgi:hypothetical protein